MHAEESLPTAPTEESTDSSVDEENIGPGDTDEVQVEGGAETIEGESEASLSESTQSTDAPDQPPQSDLADVEDQSANSHPVEPEEITSVESSELLDEAATDTETQTTEPTKPSEIENPDPEAETEDLSTTYPDPYFYVDGEKHSFLPEGGDCSVNANCTLSTTPIQTALDAATGELTPDDGIIFVEGGMYEEDITIAQVEDLTLQGSVDGDLSILSGEVSIQESIAITLNAFSFEKIINIVDSADIAITGTDQDDSIEVELEGTVDNLTIDGSKGNDEVVINLEAEESTVVVSDSGSDDEDTLIIHEDEEDLEVSDDQVTSEHGSVTLDDTIENLNIQAFRGGILVEKAIALNGIASFSGENVSVSGEIAASEIYILSADTSWVSGTLDSLAPEPNKKGGVVHVLGKRVTLLENAHVDVSGDSGGGTALIGGDYKGRGNVPSAAQTYVGSNVSIHADALTMGDGGRVIVWADELTQIYGEISAQGGSDGGNGGFIETSSREILRVIGATIYAAAPQGTAGTWLLDPHNTEIKNAANANGNFDNGNPNTFTPTADTAVADVNVINNSLNNGTSVIVSTGSTGTTQPGNLTVTDPINKTSGGDATITLQGQNNTTVNADITSSSGKLNVVIQADSDNNGAGTASINANISTNGGNATIQGADAVISGTNVVDAGAGDVSFLPSTIDSTIGIGNGAAGDFHLNSAELTTNLSSSGTVTIGNDGGTGAADIRDVNMNNEAFSMTVKGGAMTFNSTILLSDNLLFISTDTISDNFNLVMPDGTVGAVYSIDVFLTACTGTIYFDSVNGVGSPNDPIEVTYTNCTAGNGIARQSGGVYTTCVYPPGYVVSTSSGTTGQGGSTSGDDVSGGGDIENGDSTNNLTSAPGIAGISFGSSKTVVLEFGEGIFLTLSTSLASLIEFTTEILDTLPAYLPEGVDFTSGFSINLLGGESFEILPMGETILISCPMPQDLNEGLLAIFFWNPELNLGLGGWDAITEFSISADGRFEFEPNFLGTFVLAACESGICSPPQN